MASLEKIQENWERFAQADPLWAICTDRAKRGGHWSESEFLATGDLEIGKIMEYLRLRGLVPDPNTIALDFGCGVGRLTSALSRYFSECWGVDISPTMVQRAKELHKNNARCSFWLNEVDDLRIFPDRHFGFVYTSITLQHIAPRYIQKYLVELLRVLKPNGIFVFQVLDKNGILQTIKDSLAFRKDLRRLLGGEGINTLKMEMNCMPETEVRKLLSGQEVRIADIVLTNSTERSFNGNLRFIEREPTSRVSKQYCVVKIA